MNEKLFFPPSNIFDPPFLSGISPTLILVIRSVPCLILSFKNSGGEIKCRLLVVNMTIKAPKNTIILLLIIIMMKRNAITGKKKCLCSTLSLSLSKKKCQTCGTFICCTFNKAYIISRENVDVKKQQPKNKTTTT